MGTLDFNAPKRCEHAETSNNASFDTLIANVKRGYAVKGGYAYADFQALNGTGVGNVVYEIVNGKLGSAVGDAQFIFRAPEFWKNVSALGGATSAADLGIYPARMPFNRHEFGSGDSIIPTVRAVPGLVTQIAVTEPMRRA